MPATGVGVAQPVMAGIPIIFSLAALSQLLPLAAGIGARRRLTPARRWIMAWCALLAVIDAVGLTTAMQHERNLWIGQAFAPFEGGVVLWALSLWQPWPLARTTVRLAIPAYVVVWAALYVTVEDRSQFSTVVEPVYMVLGLATAAFTLVARSAKESEPLLRQDWFLVCAGLSLYFGANAALSPLGAILVERHPDMVLRAFTLKAGCDIVAFVTLSLGILCPLPTPSGASSSPPSSA